MQDKMKFQNEKSLIHAKALENRVVQYHTANDNRHYSTGTLLPEQVTENWP